MTLKGTVWLKYNKAQASCPRVLSPAAVSIDSTGTVKPVAGLMICLLQIWPEDSVILAGITTVGFSHPVRVGVVEYQFAGGAVLGTQAGR
jgi:hypothetical protein